METNGLIAFIAVIFLLYVSYKVICSIICFVNTIVYSDVVGFSNFYSAYKVLMGEYDNICYVKNSLDSAYYLKTNKHDSSQYGGIDEIKFCFWATILFLENYQDDSSKKLKQGMLFDPINYIIVTDIIIPYIKLKKKREHGIIKFRMNNWSIKKYNNNMAKGLLTKE